MKVWKGVGGNEDKILSIARCGQYKTKANCMIEMKGNLELRRKVDGEEHLKIHG